jgi:hypothetical protein
MAGSSDAGTEPEYERVRFDGGLEIDQTKTERLSFDDTAGIGPMVRKQ